MASARRKGRVLVFTGPGKGKTTAALGTALRALGRGMRVLVVQFVKAKKCGEHAAAERLAPQLEILRCGGGFFRPDDEVSRRRAESAARRALALAAGAMASGRYDMVVLDEALYAVGQGLIGGPQLRDAIAGRAEHVHVVVTGRGPWRALTGLADTVTRMQDVRHAYRLGRGTTRGIEF